MATRISEAGNTQHRYALGVLAHRGFAVITAPDADDASPDAYWAIRADGTSLAGSSPLVLAGLLLILDTLGNDWYTAPRLQLPDADIIDLTPGGVAAMAADDVPSAWEALALFATIRNRQISSGATQTELIDAVRHWIEESRNANED